MKNCIKYLFVLFVTLTQVHAQNFTNLNFESANVPPAGPQNYGSDSVSVTAALPGWAAYLGSQQVSQVMYNTPSIGTALVSLIGPTWNSADEGFTGVGIINGNYSVYLQTGANPLAGSPPTVNASIEQNGLVPSTAQTLLFDAYESTPLSVTFNGVPLAPIALSSGISSDGLSYTLYGANISAWENVTGQLEFTAVFNGSYNYDVLDDISFSSTPLPTPEPSILGLTAIGGFLFSGRKWFARRR